MHSGIPEGGSLSGKHLKAVKVRKTPPSPSWPDRKVDALPEASRRSAHMRPAEGAAATRPRPAAGHEGISRLNLKPRERFLLYEKKRLILSAQWMEKLVFRL